MFHGMRAAGAVVCTISGIALVVVLNLRVVPALVSGQAPLSDQNSREYTSSPIEKPVKSMEVAYLPGAVELAEEQKAVVLYALSDYIADSTLRIAVEAHANRTDSSMADLNLSIQRAQSLAVFISGHGIKPESIIARGFGSVHAAENEYNNRVSIKLYRGEL